MDLVAPLADQLPVAGVIAGGILVMLLVKTTRLGLRVVYYLPLIGAVLGGVATGTGLGGRPHPVFEMWGRTIPGMLLGMFFGAAVMGCGLIALTIWDVVEFFHRPRPTTPAAPPSSGTESAPRSAGEAELPAR